MQTIAVFDFDDTLVSGQSLDLFYRYVLSRESNVLRQMFSFVCVASARLFKRWPRTRQQIKFLAFLGMNSKAIEALAASFCTEVLSVRVHENVYAKLKEHVYNGDRVVVLSAGLELYLTRFFESQPNVHVIASQILTTGGTYRSISEFCYGERKMDLLRHSLKELDVDWQNSTAYSDHESDLPLLDSVGHPIVVYKGKKPDWVQPNWDVLEL